jgi:chorismate mutase
MISKKSTAYAQRTKYLEAFGIALRDEDRGPNQLRFGKQWRDCQLVDNERERAVIEKMLALRQQGFSYEKIAEILNTLDIKTKSGRSRWYAKTVRQILLRSQRAGGGVNEVCWAVA